MKTTYDPSLSMRQARKRYFEVNNFGDNGGYDDAWVNLKIGPIPCPFPNTAGRVRAVRFHDLHHILTGYDTDFHGEFEIAAWEIAAGCKDFYAAWVLNLAGMFAGLFFEPRRIAKAFARGLASQSLYGGSLDELLDQSVGETQARYVAASDVQMTAKGWLQLGLAALAGGIVGGLEVLIFVPIIPFGLLSNHLHKKSAAAAVKTA